MLQGSVLRSLLISVCTQYVVISSSLLASNTIYMLMTSKCITAVWTCSPNSRIIDPTAYLAATLEFKPSILNLPKTQLWSPPHSLHQFVLPLSKQSLHSPSCSNQKAWNHSQLPSPPYSTFNPSTNPIGSTFKTCPMSYYIRPSQNYFSPG